MSFGVQNLFSVSPEAPFEPVPPNIHMCMAEKKSGYGKKLKQLSSYLFMNVKSYYAYQPRDCPVSLCMSL